MKPGITPRHTRSIGSSREFFREIDPAGLLLLLLFALAAALHAGGGADAPGPATADHERAPPGACNYSQYIRNRSYFQNTQYEAAGPPSPEELIILEPLRSQIPPEVFTEIYQPVRTPYRESQENENHHEPRDGGFRPVVRAHALG